MFGCYLVDRCAQQLLHAQFSGGVLLQDPTVRTLIHRPSKLCALPIYAQSKNYIDSLEFAIMLHVKQVRPAVHDTAFRVSPKVTCDRPAQSKAVHVSATP